MKNHVSCVTKMTFDLRDVTCLLTNWLVLSYSWQEDWRKEKRDFLQSVSRISMLPKMNSGVSTTGGTRPGQIMSLTSGTQASSGQSSMEIAPLANKPVLEKKAAVYADVVKNLNLARERGLPFKVSFLSI